jgi:hypothetical protein
MTKIFIRFQKAFFFSFLGLILGQAPRALGGTLSFDTPLPISLPKFEKFAAENLESVFGNLKTDIEIGAVDGWVSLNDGKIAADYASVIARVGIDERFMLRENMQAALVLGAKGSVDMLLLESNNKSWIPYTWEYIILFKERTKQSEIKTLATVLSEKFKSLYVNHLEQLDILTISARKLGEESLDYTLSKKQANELAEFLEFSRSKKIIKTVELSSLNFRIPFSFSDIEILDSRTTDIFDLNKFRSSTKEAARLGWAFTTLPAFKKPFGKGPLVNNDLEGKQSYIVTVRLTESFEQCKNNLKNLDATISHDFPETLTLILTVPSDEILDKVSRLKCVESVSKYE